MSDIVAKAVHPSPLRYSGASGIKDAFVRLRTPVRLIFAPGSEFRELPPGQGEDADDPARERFAEHRGSFWRQLRSRFSDGSPRSTTHYYVTLREFVGWIEGAIGHRENEERMRTLFSGTPLYAPHPAVYEDGRADYVAMSEMARGKLLRGAKDVLWTDHERSRQRLAEFLDENVRIVDRGYYEQVYIRERPLCLPVLAPQGEDGARAAAAPLMTARSGFAMAFDEECGLPVRPDLADMAVRHWFGKAGTKATGAGDLPAKPMARLKPSYLGDSDIWLLANWLPWRASGSLAALRQGKAESTGPEEDTDLRRHAMRGLIGGVVPGEYAGVLEASMDAMRTVVAQGEPKAFDVRTFRRFLPYLDELVMPRVRTLAAEQPGETPLLATF